MGSGEEVSPFLLSSRDGGSAVKTFRELAQVTPRRATYLLVRSVTGGTKQGELQLTELKRRVDLQTLGWYTEHAVHEDTASQSSPV